jgi:uncharacterized protein YggE
MKALLTCVCLLACSGIASANITLTGTGKVTYTPDLAYVSVGASSDAKTASEAWKRTAALVKKMFEALKRLGVDPKDVQTDTLGVTPRYLNVQDEPPHLLGYTANYNLTVTVRKMDLIGRVLDDLVECGANRDVSIRFGCSDPEKALDRARARAVAEARKKADLYVKGAGAALGQVLTISEDGGPHWRSYRFEVAQKMADAPLPIATGRQEMSVSVTVTWAIAHTAGAARS